MLRQSDERILLVDHSKFNQRMVSIVEPLSAIDAIISDAPPKGALLDALNEAQVRLQCGTEAETSAA
jgi:DeoR/GlpR family transcriptional regulator of sugar metabolism